MIVETKRLLLRKINVEDAAFVLRLVNEPSFLSNIGDKGLKNLPDAERFISEGYWTSQEHPGYGMFLVALKDGGEPIGGCGLLYRKVLDVTDIGFAFLPEYWNRGFAYEAAEAMMKYGYSALGVKKIVKMSDDDPGTVLYS